MAQFEPNRLADYSEKHLLDEIRRVVTTYFNGECPKRIEFNEHSRVHSHTICQRFGSWAAAMRKAGFRASRHGLDINDLHEDLRRINDVCKGEYFTQRFYLENGGRCSPQILRRLMESSGSKNWPALLQSVLGIRKVRVITLSVPRPTPPTDDDLFIELRRVWDQLGRRPTYSEFGEIGHIGRKHYESRFGSWVKAVETFCVRIGYTIQGAKASHVSKAILSAELLAVASRCEGSRLDHPTYAKLGGTYSIGTFQNHFGSWREAVGSIGRIPGPVERQTKVKYSNEECFSELQRLWEMLGRQPKAREMNSLGKISAATLEDRFGSWMKGIHAFCADRNDQTKDRDQEASLANPADSQIVAIQAPRGITAIVQGTPLHQLEEHVRPCPSSEIVTDCIIMTTPRMPSKRLRWRVLNRDKFRCVMCGRRTTEYPGLVLHADHKKPYTLGGETTYDNLQTCCSDCNLGKSNSVEFGDDVNYGVSHKG